MAQTKRTSEEVRLAKDLITIWLNKYNNNPELAFSEFVRGHIELNITMPYFVDGMDEFKTVSKTL